MAKLMEEAVKLTELLEGNGMGLKEVTPEIKTQLGRVIEMLAAEIEKR
jgi:hypothetical protein